MEDCDLLRQYIDCRSEPAFAELVARRVNLVYSTALRILRQPDLAQDAAQSVFILLAQKARSVREPNALSGWLYRAACNVSSNLLRSEQHRRRREAEAVSRMDTEAGSPWEALSPLLDEAMRQLKPAEQDALILRYLEGKSARDAGRMLAISEDAMQKRVTRSLEKLRTHFARKGVTISITAIAVALAAHASQASPAGLAASLTSASLSSAASSSGVLTYSLFEILAMTKLKAVTLGLVFLAGLATPPILTSQVLWKRSGLEVRNSDTTVAAARAATADRNNQATSAPDPAAPLSALWKWLERADRSPLFAARGDQELPRLLRALPPADYPEAWAFQDRLKTKSLREKFANQLIERWVLTDPPAAIASILTLPANRMRRNFLSQAVSSWGADNPAAAAAWVNSYYPETERASRLMLVFYGCGMQKPQAALALWQQMPRGVARDDAARTFIDPLAAQDLNAAIACLDDIQSSQVKKIVRSDILRQWAEKDSAAALAWAQSQPRLQDRDEATCSVIAALRERSPPQAAELLKSLSSSAVERYGGAIDAAMREWARTDLNASITWARELPEGALRASAFESLIPHWVEQAPQAAAALAQTSPDPSTQSRLLTQVACEWATRDAKAALNWVHSFPDGPARNAVLSGFGDGLARQKPELAARFVAALPPGELQSQAALNVVARWAYVDPSTAAAWVAAFPPGQTRDRAITELMKEWLIHDRQAAETWLQSQKNQ